MRRALLIIILGFVGLVLLAAVGLGIFLASFNPNSYTRRISAAVEKATGRQLQFQEDVTASLFPSPSLKTGRLVMNDPGTFGGEAFVVVESASVSLAVGQLLQGVLQIEEVSLNGPVVRLITTASGQNNWEYGFGAGKAKADAAALQEEAAGRPEGSSGASFASSAGVDGVRTVPLTDPARPGDDKDGFFSHMVIQVDRFTCKDGRVFYRDLRTGAAYTGTLDELAVDSARRDADVPFAASGGLMDERDGRKARFSVNGAARLEASGILSARVDSLELEASGLAADPIALKSRADVRYDPAMRGLEVKNVKGSLDATGYAGGFAVTLPEGGAPVNVTGEFGIDSLDLDALQARLAPGKSSSGAEDVKGAPNLTRPRVSPAGGRGTSGTAPDREEKPQGDSGKKSLSAVDAVDGNVAVTVASLTAGKLPIRQLAFTLQAEKGQATIPFSLELLGGKATGSARLDLRKETPVLDLAATVRGVAMEQLCRVLDAKTIVSGTLSADVNVNGRGGSWKDMAPTLKGTTSLQVLKGEVRGFALIPSNLRGVADAPSNFAFDRISGSGKVERGIITSKDISLQAKALTGAGGGTVNLAFEQLDLGVDFRIAGQPPAIPVNIAGPFSSVSSSVDIRTLMRNTAEGALTTPENARQLLKDAEKLLLR